VGRRVTKTAAQPDKCTDNSRPVLPLPPSPATFDALVAEQAPRITRLCYRLLGWRADVADVVQDVFVAALRALPTFRGASDVSTWLTRIAVNDAELALAGLAAAEQAITEQIAKIGQRAVEAVETSPVVAEMAKVVELREQRVEYLGRMHEAGVVDGIETTAAQEQVALARVELLERREAAAARAGAGVLEKLNQDLAQKSIELAGALARRQTLQARLEDMRARNLLELSERWACEVELPRDQAQRALQRLTLEQQELGARLRSLRLPEVSVIGW